MKFLQYAIALALLAMSAAPSLGQTVTVALTPKSRAAPITLNAGELLTLSAEGAKGDVTFFGYTKEFDAKHSSKIGKTLVLTASPKQTTTYVVSVIFWDEKAIDEISITFEVVGPPTPPIPPVPVPPGPTPPIPPGPLPPAPASKVGIVLIKQVKDDNADQLVFLAKAKQYAESKGHVTWWRDIDSTDAKSKGYADAASAVGLPAIIFIDMDGKQRGEAVKLPTDMAGVEKVIREHGGLTDSGIQFDKGGDYLLVGGGKRYLTAKRTPAATRAKFAKYADSWPTIPQSKWKDFTLCDLCAPRILDQDGRGACVGHGAAGAFEMSWRINGRQPLDFDPWYLYALINGGQDGGAFVGDSLEAMQQYGVALFGSTPYAEYRLPRVPQKAKDEAKRFKPDVVYSCTTPTEIGSAAQRGHPVVFGCQVGGNFSPNSQGIIPRQSGGGGGHCMFVAGVRKINGEWYFHVVNSWSTSWGLNGTCFMPMSYFDDGDLADAYAIVTVQNDPLDPLPLPARKRAALSTPKEVQFGLAP